MSCIKLPPEIVRHTLVIGVASSRCMQCSEEYQGGDSCAECESEFYYIVFDYLDPSPSTRNKRLIAFAVENGLPLDILFLGFMTGRNEVTLEG